MKIIIKDKDKKFKIPFPLWLVPNKIIIKQITKHSNIQLSSKSELRKKIRLLRKHIKDFRGLLLVDVEEKKGTSVKIYL